MIRPEGFTGAAFGNAADGDARTDDEARRRMSARLGISAEWAIVRHVHGTDVTVADAPGHLGDADVTVTTRPGVPIAVASADCLPVVIEGDGGVAIVHAGWRGMADGVVAAARDALQERGVTAERVAIGPGIGPCCFEVGPEVAERFPEAVTKTRWGTPSVDLAAAAVSQVADLSVWVSDVCTYCGDGHHSFRRTSTPERQVAVAWVPSG
jgi:YfiH family protein